MQRCAGRVNVGVPPIFALHHGEAVLEVTGVAVAFQIGRRTVLLKVEVTSVWDAHGRASLLEVATPSIPFRVQGATIRQNVEPSIRGVHRGAALVEAEGPDVAGLVGGQAVGSDVEGARGIKHGS